MKNLVKIHPVTQRYLVIDKKRAKREAINLLQYIKNNIDPVNDEHKVWEYVVPLCEKVLHDQIDLPIPVEDRPLKYQVREGLLSPEFEEIYAQFALTITGTPREVTKDVYLNGETYTYVDFED